MGLAHSPQIVTNGLIFYYDMQNIKKSWLGKPTENLIALSGANAEIERNGTSYPYFSADITSLAQSRWTVSNNILSISFEGRRDYSQGGTGSGGDGYPSMYIYFTDWTWAAIVNVTSYEWSYNSVNNITMPNPSGKGVYFSIYHMNAGNPGRSYSRKHQVEFGSFATPFVNGTRATNNTIIDLVGQNTITASSLTYASDNTFSFNGNNNNFIDGGNNTGVLNITHPTICVWVRRTSYNSSFPMIIRRNDRDAYSLQVGQSNDTIWFKIYHGSSSWTSTPTSTIPLNTWCHFCGVFNGTQVLLYKNGQLAQSANITSPISYGEASTPQLIIGRDDAVSGRYWHGNIPNVQIYNRPLSAAEIQQNFNAQRGIYGI